MDIVSTLRKTIPWEEFDYQALLQALKDYAYPRDKITDLLAKGVIVRVKKGLYVFGDAYRTRPYSREILANLIYGPSCVSLEYALHYHGLTPGGRIGGADLGDHQAGQRVPDPGGAVSLPDHPGSRLSCRCAAGRAGRRPRLSARQAGKGCGRQGPQRPRSAAAHPAGLPGVPA